MDPLSINIFFNDSIAKYQIQFGDGSPVLTMAGETAADQSLSINLFQASMESGSPDIISDCAYQIFENVAIDDGAAIVDLLFAANTTLLYEMGVVISAAAVGATFLIGCLEEAGQALARFLL
ncbi:hypothetical protein XCY_003549 [Xanthomonas euroxanthea]|uniref:hypothetical protein n=1 Tax=Xanthomonas euroxanthea TaxID=2259622 RepID=UPI001AF58C14|nr:hypothetical protein [Xanthomonas euroxanthea]CAG2095859.1 hypothetical protein XCY_003549 [Xanthomonas euroxanthea]